MDPILTEEPKADISLAGVDLATTQVAGIGLTPSPASLGSSAVQHLPSLTKGDSYGLSADFFN